MKSHTRRGHAMSGATTRDAVYMKTEQLEKKGDTDVDRVYGEERQSCSTAIVLIGLGSACCVWAMLVPSCVIGVIGMPKRKALTRSYQF